MKWRESFRDHLPNRIGSGSDLVVDTTAQLNEVPPNHEKREAETV